MRITVNVKPGSHANRVVPRDDGSFLVLTTAIPERGKANDAVISLIAEHFKVAKSCVSIRLGKTASEKLVDIEV